MRIFDWCRRWLQAGRPFARGRQVDLHPPPESAFPHGNYDLVLRAMEQDYPFIDPAAASYREEVMLQFYARVAALIKEGVAPVPALHRAELEVLQPLKILQQRVGAGAEGAPSG